MSDMDDDDMFADSDEKQKMRKVLKRTNVIHPTPFQDSFYNHTTPSGGLANAGITVAFRGGFNLIYPSALPFIDEWHLVDICNQVLTLPAGGAAHLSWTAETAAVAPTVFLQANKERTNTTVAVNTGTITTPVIVTYSVVVQFVERAFYFVALAQVAPVPIAYAYNAVPPSKMLAFLHYSGAMLILPRIFASPPAQLKLKLNFALLISMDIARFSWENNNAVNIFSGVSTTDRTLIRVGDSVYHIQRERWDNMVALTHITRRNYTSNLRLPDYSVINK
ncbi:2 TM domain-containing transmembrane protein [Acrasis kona]|uniref:2 TM domain-containing transmembrane protein n=1 Tax=Acrasis kona TaxID=1008807 RepID=A0AAW2YNR1_9EUKA